MPSRYRPNSDMGAILFLDGIFILEGAMILNKEYSEVLRAGRKIDKSIYRREQESANIIGVCLALFIALVILAVVI